MDWKGLENDDNQGLEILPSDIFRLRDEKQMIYYFYQAKTGGFLGKKLNLVFRRVHEKYLVVEFPNPDCDRHLDKGGSSLCCMMLERLEEGHFLAVLSLERWSFVRQNDLTAGCGGNERDDQQNEAHF